MDGKEDSVKKEDGFTTEKLLFVFTLVVLVIGFILVYYGLQVKNLQKGSEDVLIVTSDIKQTLMDVQGDLQELTELVKNEAKAANETNTSMQISP